MKTEISFEYKKQVVWEDLLTKEKNYLAALVLAMMTERDILIAYKQLKAKKR